MALDGIVLNSVVYELHRQLVGGRIDKVFQPDRQTIILLIRVPGKNLQLLINGDPQQARMHLTDLAPENPAAPPAFCMLLRKYLEGGRIAAIAQQGLDRTVHLSVENWSEEGGVTARTLVVEIMGRHSNVILLDNQLLMLDALHRIPGSLNRHRELLPGRRYVAPPFQAKDNPFTACRERVLSALVTADAQQKIAHLLVQSFMGLGPGTAREIIARAGLPPETTARSLNPAQQERLAAVFLQFMSCLQQHHYQPTVIFPPHGGGVIDFACYDLLQYPDTEHRHYPSMAQAMDVFFRAERIRSIPGKDALRKLLRNESQRAERKLQLQRSELATARQAAELKLLGDLLTANIGLIRKGQREITVQNYYDPAQQEITISLDPKLSPVENAQHYYHRYAKAKRSIDILEQQIAETDREIEYLETVLLQLEDALSKSDLQEIRFELTEQSYLPPPAPTGKPQKRAAAPAVKPLRFTAPDGSEIYVGKNNKQNDYVTFKLARNQDIWLHTKDIPGSHVILRMQTGEPSQAALEMAAKLAAYFSKSRFSSQVPVDYTLRKHVHKPSGAKPGFVIYEQQHTLYVTPDEAITEIAGRGN